MWSNFAQRKVGVAAPPPPPPKTPPPPPRRKPEDDVAQEDAPDTPNYDDDFQCEDYGGDAAAAADDDDDDHDDNGWDDDDDPLDDSALFFETPRKKEKEKEEETETTTPSSNLLGRAAERFGAALLASAEKDDEYYDENYDDENDCGGEGEEEEEDGGGEGGGGFAGGFVMNGLSRFIEAATTPRDGDGDGDGDGDADDDAGWGDDDDLDFEDEEENAEEENTEEKEEVVVAKRSVPLVEDDAGVAEYTAEAGDEWGNDEDLDFEDEAGDGTEGVVPEAEGVPEAEEEDVDAKGIAEMDDGVPKTNVAENENVPVEDDAGEDEWADDEDLDFDHEEEEEAHNVTERVDTRDDAVGAAGHAAADDDILDNGILKNEVSKNDILKNEILKKEILKKEISNTPVAADGVEDERPLTPLANEQEPPEERPAIAPAVGDAAAASDSWDDEEGWEEDDDIVDSEIDVDVPLDATPKSPPDDALLRGREALDSGRSSAAGVSDSIREFVAMTKSCLDEEFAGAARDFTSPPTSVEKTTRTAAPEEARAEGFAGVVGTTASAEGPGNAGGGGAARFSADAGEDRGMLNEPPPSRGREEAGGALAPSPGRPSRSLTEFVDELDARLDDAIGLEEEVDGPNVNVVEGRAVAMTGTTVGSSSYDYEGTKDDSPEPAPAATPAGRRAPPSLPHQESWYLEAMEGGGGGVAYGEEAKAAAMTGATGAASDRHNRPPPPEEGGAAADDMGPSSVLSSEVGMPLSETPSFASSPPPGLTPFPPVEGGASDTPSLDAAPKPSELHCDCLELVLSPSPPSAFDGGAAPPRRPPGVAEKTLPDGTVVLVDYEKLLLNEATRRVALQRSAEARDAEIASLREANERLRNERELFDAELAGLREEREEMATGAGLVEAELAAATGDREYLESEVDALREENREVLQRSTDLERSFLEEREGDNATTAASAAAERMRFVDQVEMLQRELEEARGERDALLSEREKGQAADKQDAKTAANAQVEMETTFRCKIESLQQELLEKDNEIELLTGQLRETSSETSENVLLRSTIETLQLQMLGKDDEVEQLTAQLRETSSEASENDRLTSTIESLQQEVFEKDDEVALLTGQLREATLANERAKSKASQSDQFQNTMESLRRELVEKEGKVVSLTRELKVRATECEESASVQRSLRTKLDKAEARLAENTSGNSEEESTNGANPANGAEQSLRAENDALNERLEEARGACRLLESQKSNLQSDLEERVDTARSLEMQIHSLNAHIAESSTVVRGELADAKKSLDAKEEECASLLARLDRAEARFAEYAGASRNGNDENGSSEIEESLRAECSLLSKQVADLRGAHSLLEVEKSGLEKSLEERSSADQSCEMKIQTLNGKIAEFSDLERELSSARKSLDDKARECQALTSLCEQLQTEVQNVRGERDAAVSEAGETAGEARVEVLSLRAQVATLMEERDVEAKNAEDRLADALRENSDARARCEEHRAKCEESRRECANIKHSYTEEVSKLQREYLDLSASLKTAQSALEAKEAEASEAASMVDLLRGTIDTMQEETVSVAHRHQELLDNNQCLMLEKAEIAQLLETRTKAAEGQVDLLEQECARLHSNIDVFQRTSTDAERTVTDLTEQLHALNDTIQEKNSATQVLEVKASNAEKQWNLMKLECAKLRSNLDGFQKADAEENQTITNLKAQVNALKETNAKLEDKLFEASFETPEVERLSGENASLRKERNELKEESQMLSHRIDELASFANASTSPDGTFPSIEKEALLARINALEEELKAENVNELRDELTSLHEERHHLDMDNEELLVQLGLIQQEKIESQAEYEAEVETLRKRVSTLQDQSERLQDDLNKARNSSLSLGQKEHTKIIQEENSSLRQSVTTLSGQNESLKEQISNLTQEIEGLELENSKIIKNLRQKLGTLELKLADKEEEVESAKKELQNTLDAKDGEISKLTTECFSREKELKDVSGKLHAANNEMGSFNSQLESLQSRYDQDQYNQACRIVEEEKMYEDEDDISLQDLLAEAVLDSDDYLRSQIVVLAQALEKSELQRADALERIFVERKSNEASLRQLGESVKRFYSTVRC